MIRTRANGWSSGAGSKPVLDMSVVSTSYEYSSGARSSTRNNANRNETGATKRIRKNKDTGLRKLRLPSPGSSFRLKKLTAPIGGFREKFLRAEIDRAGRAACALILAGGHSFVES